MATPLLQERISTRPRREKTQHGYGVRSGLNSPYSVSDFLDDQRRILEAVTPGSGRRPCTVDRLEGRMIVMRAPHLSTDSETRQVARGALQEKYGNNAEPVLQRLAMVQDFLDESYPRMVYAGLVQVADNAEVCQEFLAYLLNTRINPTRPGLPEDTLDRFLDEWGHRWM